jgi:uncharacterized membrane-anchored protein
MGFTISDETGEMTLLDLLTAICFTAPLFAGIEAGAEAGVVGILIGIGVGLGPGVFAAYALRRTVEYYYKSEGRLKSQPWVVKKIIDLGIMVWIGFLILAGNFMAGFLTRFIVQRIAG